MVSFKNYSQSFVKRNKLAAFEEENDFAFFFFESNSSIINSLQKLPIPGKCRWCPKMLHSPFPSEGVFQLFSLLRWPEHGGRMVATRIRYCGFDPRCQHFAFIRATRLLRANTHKNNLDSAAACDTDKL